MGMWWRAVADVLRRGGGFQGGITHTQTYTQPLLCQRLGDTMSPTAIVGPAWVAPGLLCVSVCVCVRVCVSHQRGPCLGRHMPPTQPGRREGRGRPLATESTSWPILSVTRRPGAMFKVPRLFIWVQDGGRWLGLCMYVFVCVRVCVCGGGGVPL